MTWPTFVWRKTCQRPHLPLRFDRARNRHCRLGPQVVANRTGPIRITGGHPRSGCQCGSQQCCAFGYISAQFFPIFTGSNGAGRRRWAECATATATGRRGCDCAPPDHDRSTRYAAGHRCSNSPQCGIGIGEDNGGIGSAPCHGAIGRRAGSAGSAVVAARTQADAIAWRDTAQPAIRCGGYALAPRSRAIGYTTACGYACADGNAKFIIAAIDVTIPTTWSIAARCHLAGRVAPQSGTSRI